MKLVFALLGLSVAGLAVWVGSNMIPLSGAFDNLQPRLVDQCRRVDVAPGTEDVEIDEATGQVFISTFDRRGWYAGDDTDHAPGAIYLLDLNDPALEPRKISGDAPDDFSPHGVSLWTAGNGERRLFVVNHRADGGEVMEFFDVEPDGGLFHTESISFDAMYSPNDVVAIGDRQFYATNDQRHETGLMSALETYLTLPLTDVVYFDGVSGAVAADGLVYANGINKSPDGANIYVAEVLKRRISVFERETSTGALSLKTRLPVNVAPDNIDVRPDGVLMVAGHPKIFDFVAHAEDADEFAPSLVVKMDLNSMRRETVFASLNGEINGSSVGAATQDILIVGAVFDGHVMVCPL